MSGVYIHGMEMPRDCWHCFFADPEDGDCLVDQKSHGDWEEPEDCPLVPVPEHGRIVDADALIAWFAEWYDPKAELEIKHFLEILDGEDSAPTVIPRDKGKQEAGHEGR